jgi:hypothetical protein
MLRRDDSELRRVLSMNELHIALIATQNSSHATFSRIFANKLALKYLSTLVSLAPARVLNRFIVLHIKRQCTK